MSSIGRNIAGQVLNNSHLAKEYSAKAIKFYWKKKLNNE
jgi:hypothetical protein